MCSTHTPATVRKEVVDYWSGAVRRCVSCDVLDDPSSCFDSEDDSFRLRVDARAVAVANAATISRRVAQSGQRTRFGTVWPEFSQTSLADFPCLVGAIGSPPV